MSCDQWLAVFKLSLAWDFTRIRDHAKREIDKSRTYAITKALWGKKYRVKGWLLEGYSGLILQKELPDMSQLEALGWETATRLLYLRIHHDLQMRSPVETFEVYDYDLRNKIEENFREELRSAVL